MSLCCYILSTSLPYLLPQDWPTPTPGWHRVRREPSWPYLPRGNPTLWPSGRLPWAPRTSRIRTRGLVWRTIIISMTACGTSSNSSEISPPAVINPSQFSSNTAECQLTLDEWAEYLRYQNRIVSNFFMFSEQFLSERLTERVTRSSWVSH